MTGNFSNSDFNTWIPALLRDRLPFKQYSHCWEFGTTRHVAESCKWFICPLASEYRKSFLNLVLVFQKIVTTSPNTRSRCGHEGQRRPAWKPSPRGTDRPSGDRLSSGTRYGLHRTQTSKWVLLLSVCLSGAPAENHTASIRLGYRWWSGCCRLLLVHGVSMLPSKWAGLITAAVFRTLALGLGPG